MSQRGSCPKGTHQTRPRIWAYIRITVACSLFLILGTTFTLIAQDSHSPALTTKTVVLRVDGTERQVSTSKATVQELLWQEKIALHQYDHCLPAPNTPLDQGMTVTIERVTLEKIKERVTIPAPVITRWHRNMPQQPVVIREGRPGVATQYRFVWKKDGVVSEQWVQGQHVVVRPKPAIVVRGSAPSRSGSTGIRRVITMQATAYSPYDPGCNGWVANGMRAGRGIIAVDPRVIPLGTRVYVDGYGPAIAADTGGAIKGNRIDVCFSTRGEALQWGRRSVKVVVLE